jgi:hypothetical protein
METITKESASKVFKTTALISKKAWFVISLLVCGALFIPFKESEKSLLNLPKLDFSFLNKIQTPNLFETISISNTVLYAVFLFGLLFIGQVIFLKNHFNKRFH